MEISDLVAEFVALSRRAKSEPLGPDDRRRWNELRTSLLVAQVQPAPAGHERPGQGLRPRR